MRRLIGQLNGKAKWMGTLVLLMTMKAAAQTAETSETKTVEAPKPSRLILVSIPDRKLALIEDGRVLKVFPVAVGKDSTPSPKGTFTVKSHVVNPTYYHSGKVIPAGPGNPLGNRWMGLSEKGYGIHGTNEPKSIGKAASHGCIRMAKKDLEELFPIVKVGDTVEIRGERDEEVARVFGVESDATPSLNVVAQTTVAANAGGF